LPQIITITIYAAFSLSEGHIMPYYAGLRGVSGALATGALLAGGLAAATTAPATAATTTPATTTPASTTATSITATQVASRRSAIGGTRPAWAVMSARVDGPAAVAGTVTARIYLAGRDPAGLAAYAVAVSTPGDGLYHHYLTPAQVTARFAASSTQVAAIRSWLTSAGLAIVTVNDRNVAGGYITARGPAAAAGQAFGVTFAMYRGPDGHAQRAPSQTATVPAPLAGAVLAVSGLDTASHLMKPDLPPPGLNYWTAPSCSAYYGQKIARKKPAAYGRHQPWTNCGYTPSQIRGAYGVTAAGMTGRGQTVAIVDAYASPTMPADANQYAKITGDRPFTAGQYRQFQVGPFTQAGPAACGAPGWYGEETLDIESVHGQAPAAGIRYVAAANCTDSAFIQALAFIVNRNLASIVSDSWGDLAESSTLNAAYDLVFQTGAAEGIGFFFSSGDSGYESPGEDPASAGEQVDYPTSSPYVTSVGGTSLAIGKHSNYEWETAWGTMLDPLAAHGKSWSSPPPGSFPADYDGSSGGGVSTQYLQPAYQNGVVPASLATRLPDGTVSATPMRVVPDVSALADPSTGFLVGQTTLQPDGTTYAFSLSRIGGTSVSSPTFAGIEADAQQACGSRLGLANPVIYARYGTSAFHDITAHPAGQPDNLAEVRSNYTDAGTRTGPLITDLRTLGINGEGSSALEAVQGYDDATGVGSPRDYIQSFQH
jgi:subtilase family serine protease